MRAFPLLACCCCAGLALAAPIPPPRGGELGTPGWHAPVDPDRDCRFTKGRGSLTIELPAKDHDIDGNRGRNNAPRLLRDFEGDFRIDVRVRADFHATAQPSAPGVAPFTAGGLIVYLGDSKETSLRLELVLARSGAKAQTYVALKAYSAKAKGSVSAWAHEGQGDWALPAGAKQAHLRLERRGTMFTPWYSADGRTWVRSTRLGLGRPPEKLKVGVVALNTSKGPLKVTFDQFELTKLSPSPK